MCPHLFLLGGFDCAGYGETAPVLGRKTRALLAYLALQSGRPQQRAKLGSLLWGSGGEEQARLSLRQALSALRKSLPCAVGERIATQGDGVLLVLDDTEVDVARFELLAAGPSPAALEQAIALYRGDLLDGFGLKEEPFEDWLRGERERLRCLATATLERLLAHYGATRDTTACVRVATRLLAFDPLREDIHRELMQAYANQGRLSLALRQYGVCRELVARQLGAEPEAETRRLYDRLRALRSAPHAVPSRPSAGPNGALPALPSARPPTRYVKSGGIAIAYQVMGEGPLDLLYVPGWVSNLDFAWASPRLSHVLARLGSFCRLIRIDKRGTGLSDRNIGLPTLEQRMEDVRAVLDAIGSRRTVLFGSSEGGNMCMLFAAKYPERTAALILNGSYARGMWSIDYPWAKTPGELADELAAIERDWGEPADLSKAAPSLMDDAFEREWFATFLRNSASPADAVDLWRWGAEIDVRDILPIIHVPTLIMQSVGDRWVQVEEGRYLASHIAGARYVELPGDDHVIWGRDADRLVDEIETFLGGVQSARLRRAGRHDGGAA